MNDPVASDPVAIIGAGVAGLRCAIELERRGVPYQIFDREDRIGGKIRTDNVAGCLVDRGFQVLLSNYSEWQELFPHDPLRCRSFRSGAYIRVAGKMHALFDPRREPGRALASFLFPYCSWRDKFLLPRTLRDAKESERQVWAKHSTLEYLKERGYSSSMIGAFFKPFFGGVFLDPELTTRASIFLAMFARFATGAALLPAQGMESIPEALRGLLKRPALNLNQSVVRVTPTRVECGDGSVVRVRGVVVAGAEQDQLLLGTRLVSYRSVSCTYFLAARPPAPLEDRALLLNADVPAVIDHVVPLSSVQPSYCPIGQQLLAVVTLDRGQGSPPDPGAIEKELSSWFPTQKLELQFLTQYFIKDALPAQTPSDDLLTLEVALASPGSDSSSIIPGLIRCGDHVGGGSLQGVLASGRKAAAIISDFWLRAS